VGRGVARRLVLRGVRLGTRIGVVLVLVPGLTALTASTAAADPSAKDWERLRACESGGRYDVVATHEHYGAYQFDLPTWVSVGGKGLPSTAAPNEQDYRALFLYRLRGWQPWECAAILGLRPEKDAGNGQPPDPADAAYMRPHEGPDRAPDGTNPKWPGKVFQPGDCDSSLRTWQLRMNAWGYDFDGTGCYGEETRRAAIALQRRHHLPETGRLGPRTWQAAWETPP
jgi:resuscitation-promoting factor RpfA